MVACVAMSWLLEEASVDSDSRRNQALAHVKLDDGRHRRSTAPVTACEDASNSCPSRREEKSSLGMRGHPEFHNMSVAPPYSDTGWSASSLAGSRRPAADDRHIDGLTAQDTCSTSDRLGKRGVEQRLSGVAGRPPNSGVTVRAVSSAPS
jgi:hypothetical protein